MRATLPPVLPRARLADLGYALTRLRALDAFPLPHHGECIAVFEPSGAGAATSDP